MDEFLIPATCTEGAGLFVCVAFAGLNAERYDSLVIELERTGERQTVERDKDAPWSSTAAAFRVEEDDVGYTVKGYVTEGGETRETEAVVPAQWYDALRLLLKAARMERGTGAIPNAAQAEKAIFEQAPVETLVSREA